MIIPKQKDNEQALSKCKQQLFGLRDSLEILGGKWKLLIVLYLYNRNDEVNHFKKIQRGIEGISAKMLSKELKDLEINKLVTRTVKDDGQIMVIYELSEYGKTILPIMEILMEWGVNHRTAIK